MIRNWSLVAKLGIVGLVPLSAAGLFAALEVKRDLDRLSAVERVRASAELGVAASVAEEQVRLEEDASVAVLADPDGAGRGALADQRERADSALASFQKSAAGLELGQQTNDQVVRSRLEDVDRWIVALPTQRRQVDLGSAATAELSATYEAGLELLDGLTEGLAVDVGDPAVARLETLLFSVAELKDTVARERALGDTLLTAKKYQPQTYGEFRATIGAQQPWLSLFNDDASPAERDLFAGTVRGAEIDRSAALRLAIIGAGDAGNRPQIDAQAWNESMTARIALLESVEEQVGGILTRVSADAVASARNQVAFGIGAVIALFALSALISLAVARSLVRSLRLVRDTALDVAARRLPETVERIQMGLPVEQTAHADAVEVHSADEIGQVADAFNQVHRVAVDVTVEQAMLRKSVGNTFLNLARRNQALIHRQLKLIDRLERSETDPERMTDLFDIDHIATRMRRHAEDLIILSGSSPARGWRRPVLIREALRASIAEVEDYRRVELAKVGESYLSGHTVADVIHLVAELIENATSFSPPHTTVRVSGEKVATGYVIEVEDRGLGMTAAELEPVNAKLADPPKFDLATSERLGLFVVGQLAARQRIRVSLRPSSYGGIIAVVLLPQGLLEARSVEQAPGQEDAENHDGSLDPGAKPVPVGRAAPASAMAGEAATEVAAVGASADASSAASPWLTPVRSSTDAGQPSGAARTQPTPPSGTPLSLDGATSDGLLPRRTRQRNIAPQLTEEQGLGQPLLPQSAKSQRDPGEVRRRLAAFQDGAQHGRETGSHRSRADNGHAPAKGEPSP